MPVALVDAIDASCRRPSAPSAATRLPALRRGDRRGRGGINQCPPGGDAGIRAARRADRARRTSRSIRRAASSAAPRRASSTRRAASAARCASRPARSTRSSVPAKLMHTVIAALCTGCELCVPPCPVDCIAMVPAAGAAWDARVPTPHGAARARLARLERDKAARTAVRAQRGAASRHGPAAIRAAIAPRSSGRGRAAPHTASDEPAEARRDLHPPRAATRTRAASSSTDRRSSCWSP